MSLVNASELDTSPARWAVGDNAGSTPGILPEIGTGFAWGPRTAGKSLVFGIELGLAIANGTKFFGHPTTKGKVVYCVGEGLYDLGLRKQARLARQARDDTNAIAACARDYGDEAARDLAASLPAYTDENLYLIDRPFTVPLTNPGRAQTDELKQAITMITQLNTPGPDDDPDTFPYVQLVILDSLADFTARSMSNDSSANLIVGGMKTITRELECVTLAIAHPTEQGGKMLGAGRLLNAADFEIEIQLDDTAAPGALRTASVISHKSKYSALFDTIGYQVEPCEWSEPVRDDDGEIVPGETVRVRSATVRMLDTSTASSGPSPARQPAPPLPEIQDTVPKSRKRSGIRPRRNGLHLVTSQDTAPPPPAPAVVPASGPVSAKQDLARALLAVRCPTCSRPASMGCDARMDPAPWPLARTAAGQSYIHEDRIVAAALAQPDPEGFLDAALATLTGTSTTPPPPLPKPARPALDDRLSWTTVRPDSPAPTLAEIMAGT